MNILTRLCQCYRPFNQVLAHLKTKLSICVFFNSGDKSALRPSGLRFGTPALTSRGFLEDDFKKVAQYIHRGIELTLEIQNDMNPKATLKEFKDKLASDAKHQEKIKALREEVEKFAGAFPIPGLPDL
ncbi:serine hydroxymethyltransferase, cytosolic-like [Bombina bombina]|uniref:serine hydroxymethyltransferase, cytosolic-like n=1 Tax=Bombina bombina TaxID=8345 RepID=UPI00235B0483|nr:serine hydroxymethyltransferase, cytosolic-like [Bombina bombina]